MKRAIWTFAAMMLGLMLLAIGYGATAEAQRALVGYYPNAAWSSSTTYAVGDMITTGGVTYISNVFPNVANNPSSTTTGYCTGFAVPCWTQISGSGGGGGSYLPLAGGTLTGNIGEVSQTLTATDANNQLVGGTEYAHIYDQSTFALAPVTSGLGSQVQSVRTMTTYGPGLNLGNIGGGRTQTNTYLPNTWAARGITQAYSSYSYKHAVGDSASNYHYIFSDGGSDAASDEGIGVANFSGGETTGYYHGTIASTTGTGDIAPVLSTATSGNNWTTDGAFLLNISKGTISGNYSGSTTSFGSTYLPQIPVTNTLPLSSAWGTLTTVIANPSVTPNNSATNSFTVTLGAIGGSTPSFTAGKVCIAGPNHPEQAILTNPGAASGGTQTITLTYHNPNGYGSTYPILFQGGVCGQYISEDANLAYSGYRTSYYAFGAVTTGNLIYGVNSHGNMNSQGLPMASEAQTTTSGYHLYPGAELVENTTTGGVPVLEPNSVAWAAGDVVENPHFPIVNTDGLKIDITQNTPANNANSAVANFFARGYGVAGGNYFGINVNNFNPSTYYKDFGGAVNRPFCGYCLYGYWGIGSYIDAAPSPGGAVTALGSPNGTTAYNIFLQEYGTGAGAALAFNPATLQFNFTRPLTPSSYPVFGASGSTHAQGAVPDPGATAGNTHYLREDGTWQVPSGGGGTTTINGTACASGGSCTITAANPNSLTFATTGGAASATTYNGSAAATIDAHSVGAATSVGAASAANLVTQLAAAGINLAGNANNALYLMQGLSGTSGTLVDSSGNGNSATWSNFVNPTFPTAQGAYFNGAAFFQPTNLGVCTNAGTVMVWYKRQGANPLNFTGMAFLGTDTSAYLGTSEANNGALAATPVSGTTTPTAEIVDRTSGNSSAAFVFGSPMTIYPNGRPALGYIVQGNYTAMTASSTCKIGYSAAGAMIGWIYAEMMTPTLTPAQISAANTLVEQYLATKGINFQEQVSPTVAPAVYLGDSRFFGAGVNGALRQTISYFANQQQGPNGYPFYNLGLNADTASNMATGTTRVSGWRTLLTQFDTQPVLIDESGYNDLGASSAATILGYKESIAQQAASSSATLLTQAAVLAQFPWAGTTHVGSDDTSRQTLYSTGVAAILAGTYGASGQTVGLVQSGAEPLFGYLQNMGDVSATDQYALTIDGVHPGAVWNKYLAQYDACALALLSQNQPCTVAIRVPRGDLIGTSATTGSIPIFQLLPGQVVTQVGITPLAANKGTSVTAMTISVGDTNGTTTQYAAAASVFAQSQSTAWSAPTTQPTPGGVVTAYYTATGGNVNAVYTDLAVASGSNVLVSSASHPFVALDLNTKIYVSAGTGFTAGLYNVSGVCTGSGTGTGTGVAACTASGQAVLDHSPAAVSTTGGSYVLGDVVIYLTVESI